MQPAKCACHLFRLLFPPPLRSAPVISCATRRGEGASEEQETEFGVPLDITSEDISVGQRFARTSPPAPKEDGLNHDSLYQRHPLRVGIGE